MTPAPALLGERINIRCAPESAEIGRRLLVDLGCYGLHWVDVVAVVEPPRPACKAVVAVERADGRGPDEDWLPARPSAGD